MTATLPACAPSGIATAAGFRAAVDGVMPRLTRYTRRLAGNGVDADDLLQDTLLRAWAGRGGFVPGSNLEAWLTRIARNTFLTQRRRAGRQVLWESDDIARALVAGPDQETALLLGELDEAIDALPEPQHRAFRLVVLEGRPYEEAAATLHVQLGTVKSQVSRARMALVSSLDQGVAPRLSAEAPAVRAPEVRISAYDRWKASGRGLIGAAPQQHAA